MTVVSGILGTGHHFFYMGATEYWLWIGSISSAVEPLPFLLMILFAFTMARDRKIKHDNEIALTGKGTAVMSFIGVCVWGFFSYTCTC